MNLIEGEIASKLVTAEIPAATIAVMNSYASCLFESGCDCITPFISEKDGVVFGMTARLGAATFEISCLKRPGTEMFLLKVTKSLSNEHWSYGVVIGKQLLHIQQLTQRAANVFN